MTAVPDAHVPELPAAGEAVGALADQDALYVTACEARRPDRVPLPVVALAVVVVGRIQHEHPLADVDPNIVVCARPELVRGRGLDE